MVRVEILYNVSMFSSYSESLYSVTLLSGTIKVINPAIIQSYHHYPHRLAGLPDDIVFISVMKEKFN